MGKDLIEPGAMFRHNDRAETFVIVLEGGDWNHVRAIYATYIDPDRRDEDSKTRHVALFHDNFSIDTLQRYYTRIA